MTAVLCSLSRELHLDFARAREELDDARHRQRQKDTPDHRSAVAACLARIDAVLDMYLETLDLPARGQEPLHPQRTRPVGA